MPNCNLFQIAVLLKLDGVLDDKRALLYTVVTETPRNSQWMLDSRTIRETRATPKQSAGIDRMLTLHTANKGRSAPAIMWVVA